MNIDKFGRIVKAVRAAYPQFKFIESKEGMEIWLKALDGVPDDVVSLAFEKHIMTAKFPPTIAEIRENIFNLSDEKIRDWSDAFGLALRAIRKFGSYREDEALEWISEQDRTAAEVTRRLGFKELCLSENMEVIRGQFRMAYTNYAEQKKYYGMLPDATKKRQLAIESDGKRRMDGLINKYLNRGRDGLQEI